MENKKRRINGARCIAINCSNTNKDGVSLHHFPMGKPHILAKWVDFVRQKRKDWSGPSSTSVLCEEHFVFDTCYPVEYRIKKSTGLPIGRKTLLPEAIPTIHKETTEGSHAPPKAKKMRMAFVKRENERILAEVASHAKTQEPELPVDTSLPMEDIDSPLPSDKENQIVQVPIFTTSVACQTTFKPSHASRRTTSTQTKPKGIDMVCQTGKDLVPKQDVSVQCSTGGVPAEKPIAVDVCGQSVTSVPSLPSPAITSPVIEEEYVPSPSCDYDSEEEDELDDSFAESERSSPQRFIVDKDQLLQLFERCPSCTRPTLAECQSTMGTLAKVTQECGSCGYHRVWSSQPLISGIPEVNIMLSAAVLFSGSLWAKVYKLLSFLSIASICKDTFMRHQRQYLFPSVTAVWKRFQEKHFADIKRSGSKVIVGGDGRCDTPGHSAKYGSYCLLDLDNNYVVEIQVVQSNEVPNSYHMEKEGLRRCVDSLHSKGVQIQTIVTDRHSMIVKFIRETMPETQHFFDVWHVAKGLKKKLTALANQRDCADLLPWIKSIHNHLYWTAASTPDGNPDVMLQKWESLYNHIQNIHSGHGNLFSECEHGELEGRELHKKWLQPDTKVCDKLGDIVASRQMKSDVRKLSPGYQTSELEGFHSLINHYAPKMVAFSYQGMIARITLAALHYNENSSRQQAVTSTGIPRYSIQFPKFKKGGHTVRDIKVPCTYEYVHELMEEVREFVRMDSVSLEIPKVPPPLCQNYQHPDKIQAALDHVSRFTRAGNLCTAGWPETLYESR